MSEPKHVLLVFGGNVGGRTYALVAAAQQGMLQAMAECDAQLCIRGLPALEAGVEDLLWANGLLLATPEHFGYMAGSLKHFFDRTFYAVEGKMVAVPYSLLVSAGNDGSGAASAVGRIARGYRWKPIAEPLIVRGEPTPQALQRCRELGQLLAAGLALNIF